jgi:hypothetical protein
MFFASHARQTDTVIAPMIAVIHPRLQSHGFMFRPFNCEVQQTG